MNNLDIYFTRCLKQPIADKFYLSIYTTALTKIGNYTTTDRQTHNVALDTRNQVYKTLNRVWQS